jgi:hypothetical protein
MVLVVAAMAACSGDSSSGAQKPATSTSEAAGDAKVTSFEVPASAECAGSTSTTVTVSYATSGASKQELYVDGRTVPGTDATSGSVTAPVHCDPLPHTFVMIAYDTAGRRTALEKKLTTNS